MWVVWRGNGLMVAAVIADRRLRTVTNTFMVSLAISDVLIATVNMPVQLCYDTVPTLHSSSLCLVQSLPEGPPTHRLILLLH